MNTEFARVFKNRYGFYVLIGFSILMVYGVSLQYFFWQDDFNLIEYVRDSSLNDYITISFTPPEQLLPLNLGVVFRPIPHYLFFQINYSIFGTNPLPFRLVNFVLFFITVILLQKITKYITNSGQTALLAAILFSINRIHLSTMFWISANNEIFLALFSLLSIITFLGSINSSRGRRRWTLYAVSLISLLCGLLSKETAVAIPALIAVTILISSKTHSLKTILGQLLYLLPHITVSLIFVLVRLPLISYAVQGGGGSYYGISNLQHIITSLMWGLWWCLETFVEPWRSIFDVITQDVAQFSLFQPLLISALFLTIAVIIIVASVKHSHSLIVARPIILGGLWFIISALPSIITGILVDYLFTLSSVGFVLILAYIIDITLVKISREYGRNTFVVVSGVIVFCVLSGSLVINKLSQTVWPVAFMPYTIQTIDAIKETSLPTEKEICLINIPDSIWLPGRAGAALRLFVDKEIEVLEVSNTANEFSILQYECPQNSIKISFEDSDLIITPYHY